MPALSKEEKTQLRRAFTYFDTNGSGYIEKEEFQALVDELGAYMTDAEVHATFKSIDTNRDCDISYDEFLTWWTSPASGPSKSNELKSKLKGRTYAANNRCVPPRRQFEAVVTANPGELSYHAKIKAGNMEPDDRENMAVHVVLRGNDTDADVAAIKSLTELDHCAAAVLTIQCQDAADDVDLEDLRTRLEDVVEMLLTKKPEDVAFDPVVKVRVGPGVPRHLHVCVSLKPIPGMEASAEQLTAVANALEVAEAWAHGYSSQAPGRRDPPEFAFFAEGKVVSHKRMFDTAKTMMEDMGVKEKLRRRSSAAADLLKAMVSSVDVELETPDRAMAFLRDFLEAPGSEDAKEIPPPVLQFMAANDKWEFFHHLLCDITLLLNKALGDGGGNGDDSYSDDEGDEQLQLFRSLLEGAGANLRGLKDVRAHVGDKFLHATFENADVFTLVPTLEAAKEYAKTRWSTVVGTMPLQFMGPLTFYDCDCVHYAAGTFADLTTDDSDACFKFWRVDLVKQDPGAGKPASLSRVQFVCGDDGDFEEVTPVAVAVPEGASADSGEVGLLVVDGDSEWLAREVTTTLVFEFAEPVVVRGVGFIAGKDSSSHFSSFSVYAGCDNHNLKDMFLLPRL